MTAFTTAIWFLVFASPNGGVIVAAYDSEGDCLDVAATIQPHLSGAILTCVDDEA